MFVSWFRRSIVVFLTTLLSITPFTTAFATTPEFITVPVDETYEVVQCDGFTVIEHLGGEIKVSFHSDQDGLVQMRITRVAVLDTFSNSETGASLSSPLVGIDKLDFNRDRSHTVAVVGMRTHLVVPGVGLIFIDAGRFVYDSSTDSWVFEAGRHDNFDDALPALCSALG